MSWWEDLTRPVFGRVWQAFFGFGHNMEVWICTDPHFYAAVGNQIVAPNVPPHLHVRLRLWSKGGADVSIVSWETNVTKSYTGSQPIGPFTLEKSGKPLTLEWELHPKAQPLEFKPGDSFEVKVNLSNGIPKRFKAAVKATP